MERTSQGHIENALERKQILMAEEQPTTLVNEAKPVFKNGCLEEIGHA